MASKEYMSSNNVSSLTLDDISIKYFTSKMLGKYYVSERVVDKN